MRIPVTKNYLFDAPHGTMSLADLFRGRNQLRIKHLTVAPETDPLVPQFDEDISYAAVTRAPIEKIESVRDRMGWRFLWVSSLHNDFSADFSDSATFYRDENGAIYRSDAA